MVDLVGWLATAVFISSYFCKRPETMRRVQMLGAMVWIVYGVLIPAPPVIAANILVVGAVAWTSRRTIARADSPAPSGD